MPYVTNPRDGVRIHYRVEGSGPPLVLYHGFSAESTDWYETGYVDALKDDFQLIVLDARGHGASDKPHDEALYPIGRQYTDVPVLLDELGIERTHYMGYSMGGRVGYALGAFHPERLRSLIIGGIGPFESDRAHIQRFIDLMRQGTAAWVSGWWDKEGLTTSPGRRSRILAADAEAFVAVLRGSLNFQGYGDKLAGITTPSLIYAGDQDGYHDDARRGAAAMPNATFVSLPGLNHITGHTRSDQVLPHVQAFLASVD